MTRHLALIFLASCGSSTPNEPDAAIDPPDAPIVTRTVTGTVIDRHVTSSGEVTVPRDLSTLEIAAFVAPAFDRIQGIGTADGTFEIPGVPEGPYTLTFGFAHVVTDRSSHDFSTDVLGRADVAVVANPSPMTFNVGNLQAWQTGDELQMFVPGSGTIAYAMQDNANQSPPVGATTLTNFTFDLSRADYRADIDGSAGDLLLATQLSTQTVGAHTFRAVSRGFAPAAFSIGNGGTATLNGSFTIPAANATLDVTWDRAAFDSALRTAVPGSESLNYSVLGASALPEAGSRGLYHSAPDLLVFEPGYSSDASNVVAAWPYRDPFPAAWTRTLTARYFTFRYIQLGSADPRAVFASIDVDVDRATLLPSATLAPLITPVLAPKINGSDAFGAVAGMGLTPTISWEAPSIGTASMYSVVVGRVVDQAGATAIQSLAQILTPSTSVVIPPGVIVPGGSYVFAITVRSAPGIDLQATPARTTLPEGRANLTTAIATP
jgi:hypothetical protein